MRAALLQAYGEPLSVEAVPDPSPGRDDAVIQVEACGICRSDWHVWSGDWQWRMSVQFPHVLGHEVAGRIVDVGSGVRHFRSGDPVSVPFHLSCQICAFCRADSSNLCDNYTALGFHLAGGFAEYMRVPDADANLFHLPESLSTRAAAALGCRYTSAYHGLVDQVMLKAGERVAVFGCGGLGLSVIHLAAALGGRVIAIDPRAESRALAENAGAEATLEGSADAEQVAAKVHAVSDGGVAIAVDALGSASTLHAGLLSLAKRGRHLQLGLTGAREKGRLPVPIDAIAKRELRVVGAVGCPAGAFKSLIGLIADGVLSPEPLIAGYVDLKGVSRVLAAMSHFGTVGLQMVAPWSTIRTGA